VKHGLASSTRIDPAAPVEVMKMEKELVARQALKDCHVAWAKLELALEPRDWIDRPDWRVEWIAVVTLLRAVGHVLDKIDGDHNPAIRAAVDGAWRRWKSGGEHAIFRDFIDRERNNVLKNYRFSAAHRTRVVRNPGRVLEEGFYIPYVEREFFEMEDGPFKGRDARDLIRDAMVWWELELDKIEGAARWSDQDNAL